MRAHDDTDDDGDGDDDGDDLFIHWVLWLVVWDGSFRISSHSRVWQPRCLLYLFAPLTISGAMCTALD